MPEYRLKCQLCGQIADRLYPCRFRDDPDDTYGYTLNVCAACVPENQKLVALEDDDVSRE